MKCAVFLWVASVTALLAAEPKPSASPESESLASALSPNQWKQVEESIDRALAWLARQQESDGSIDAPDSAQPAATSLTVMAFLSKGHLTAVGTPDEVRASFGKGLSLEDIFVQLQEQAT